MGKIIYLIKSYSMFGSVGVIFMALNIWNFVSKSVLDVRNGYKIRDEIHDTFLYYAKSVISNFNGNNNDSCVNNFYVEHNNKYSLRSECISTKISDDLSLEIIETVQFFLYIFDKLILEGMYGQSLILDSLNKFSKLHLKGIAMSIPLNSRETTLYRIRIQNSYYCIKKYNSHLIFDQSIKEKKVRSENIVKVFATFFTKHKIYKFKGFNKFECKHTWVLYENFDKPLKDCMKKIEDYPVIRIVARNIFNVFKDLHKNNIYHGDINYDNIVFVRYFNGKIAFKLLMVKFITDPVNIRPSNPCTYYENTIKHDIITLINLLSDICNKKYVDDSKKKLEFEQFKIYVHETIEHSDNFIDDILSHKYMLEIK